VKVFGADRVLLTPDCGFATFADNPVASPEIAEAKLRALVQATEIVRRG
jgi:5-methyltetrahydropteroyltriglutamate--homocysteine methyltransferase